MASHLAQLQALKRILPTLSSPHARLAVDNVDVAVPVWVTCQLFSWCCILSDQTWIKCQILWLWWEEAKIRRRKGGNGCCMKGPLAVLHPSYLLCAEKWWGSGNQWLANPCICCFLLLWILHCLRPSHEPVSPLFSGSSRKLSSLGTFPLGIS